MSPEIGLVSAIVGGTVACLFGGMVGDGGSKGRTRKGEEEAGTEREGEAGVEGKERARLTGLVINILFIIFLSLFSFF